MAIFGFERIDKPFDELSDVEYHNNLIYSALEEVKVLSDLVQGEESDDVLKIVHGSIRRQWSVVASLLVNNLDADHLPFRETLERQEELITLLIQVGTPESGLFRPVVRS